MISHLPSLLSSLIFSVNIWQTVVPLGCVYSSYPSIHSMKFANLTTCCCFINRHNRVSYIGMHVWTSEITKANILFTCPVLFDYVGHSMMHVQIHNPILLIWFTAQDWILTISNRTYTCRSPVINLRTWSSVSARVVPDRPESFLSPPPKLCFPSNLDHMPLIVCNLLRGEIYVPSLSKVGGQGYLGRVSTGFCWKKNDQPSVHVCEEDSIQGTYCVLMHDH